MATDMTLNAPLLTGFQSMAGSLYTNIESFPGQIYTLPTLQSAREEGRKSRRDIVRAARHVERQSEHIRGGIDKKVDYVVGPRLMVHARPDFEMLGITDEAAQEKLTKSLEREFRNWAYDPRLLQDGEGHSDFGGLMWIAMRNVTGADGECALTIEYDEKRRREYGARWATFVTLIDPDRIETPPMQSSNPRVQDGIVLDPNGRRIGMFVRKERAPGETSAVYPQHSLVPRETRTGRPVGVHWFVKNRAAQLRGISTLVSIIKQTGMVDKFDDAYLAAAVINQVLATWIESPAPVDQVAENIAPAGENGVTSSAWTLFENKLGYYDKAKIRIGGSRIPVMPPGDKINMSSVNRAMEDPSALRDGFLRMFSSAIGISFEQLAQKFGDANFSSARAAFTDAMIGILRIRMHFGQAVPALIYSAVVEEAFVRGRLDMPAGAPDFYENRYSYCACEVTGPAAPQVDPEKEAKAFQILLDTKLTSRQQIIAAMGSNYIDVFDQIAKERGEAEERGFTLDPLMPGTPGTDGMTAPGDQGSGGDGEAKPNSKNKKAGKAGRDGDGQVQEDQ